MRQRCINLDWLEVYVLEPPTKALDASYFRNQGWKVEERAYGTRSYKQMFTLLDYQTEEPFLEVRREPVGMFKNGDVSYLPPNGCHLRLTNRYCYFDNAANMMAEFLDRYKYTFQRISKVDLALDFERFDFGDYPQRFLERYISGKFSKINQSNIAARGKDEWHGRFWNSCSWGAEKSPVLTRFYCKSQELEEVKDKPYIRQAWAICGLVDDVVTMQKSEDGQWRKPDIWRLEFSVRSGVKNWVTCDNQLSRSKNKKISFRNDLAVYSTRPGMMTIFASLVRHYFHFKLYQDGKSKYKCEDKKLFDFNNADTYYSVEKVATSRPRSEIVEKLLKQLSNFILITCDTKAKDAALMLVDDLQRMQLERMAVRPWDETEVSLLRHLIALRLQNPDMPYVTAQDMAESMVDLEQSLWQDDLGQTNTASLSVQ